MTELNKTGSDKGWICHGCESPLEVQTVRLEYRGNIFAVHLPVCPLCGMILIDEELATREMAEGEQIVEDK